jgi:4a-hydroxytetrahydrobiopterin dehydratase
VSIEPLSDQQVAGELSKLKGWSLEDGKLHRSFKFRNFIEAMGFMMRVALVAESMGHHPSWSNVWNRVDVDLWTDSIHGISKHDVELASRIQELAGA